MGEAKKRLLVIALLVSACGGAVEPSTVAAEGTPAAPSASPTAGADASGLSPIPIDSVPIGACFNENRGPTTDRIFAVVVPCDGPHQLEMIGSEVLPERSEVTYPGAEAMNERGNEICRPLFESYVGIDYDDSEFVFWYYTPDEANWPLGNRFVSCTIGNADRSMQPPGSVRNAGR